MPGTINKINWECFSNQERNTSIENIKSVISSNDGYIINFNVFSDLALSLTIEIEEFRILKLYNDLKLLVDLSSNPINKFDMKSRNEWRVIMNISFSKGEGNLKTEIPNVPG